MEMLKDTEAILAARSAQALWQHYCARLAALGFAHVCYRSVRALTSCCNRILDDGLLLSSYPPHLMQELAAQDLLASAPMYSWLAQNGGWESWAWMQRRRLAGRLPAQEQAAADIFMRHGHVSGYAIGLGNEVDHIRAGLILGGAIGMRQDQLDQLWASHGRVVVALSGLMHLRISTLPQAPQECMLTLRQREVLECIAVGHTTQEIAAILALRPATVEKHLRLARKALGAKTTAQAILLAASRKLIFLPTGAHPPPAGETRSAGAETGQAQPWGARPGAAFTERPPSGPGPDG